jgi:hypothetical protein
MSEWSNCWKLAECDGNGIEDKKVSTNGIYDRLNFLMAHE